MAMAMHSERAKPSSPRKAGILPRGLALRCSTLGALVSASTMFRSMPLALATALMATLRGLSCDHQVSPESVVNSTDQNISAYTAGEESSESHCNE